MTTEEMTISSIMHGILLYAKEITEISSHLMIITAAFTYLVLTYWKTAPYGKFTTSKGWGMLLPAKWCWMIMESPNLWNTLVIFLVARQYRSDLPILSNFSNQCLLGLYLLHYCNRALIFPLFLAKGNPMPISVMGFAFLYCFWNSVNQATSLILVHQYPEDYWTSPQFLIGTALFFLGFSWNIQSDMILINLKRQRVKALEEDPASKRGGYVIPRKGLFEFVSAANYFGEIVEWIGFAIACQSIAAVAFAVYTFANLVPRGVAQHRWYQENFPNYPSDRKAVLPFLL